MTIDLARAHLFFQIAFDIGDLKEFDDAFAAYEQKVATIRPLLRCSVSGPFTSARHRGPEITVAGAEG